MFQNTIETHKKLKRPSSLLGLESFNTHQHASNNDWNLLLLSIFLVFELRALLSCWCFMVKMYWMFYVNDEPEGKFLYTETIKLYCIVIFCLNQTGLVDSFHLSFIRHSEAWKGGLPWTSERALFCPMKIGVLFNLLRIWIQQVIIRVSRP